MGPDIQSCFLDKLFMNSSYNFSPSNFPPPTVSKATPYFSTLVLECWERDRDDSDDDVRLNRALGIQAAQPTTATSTPSSLRSNIPSSSGHSSCKSSLAKYSDLSVIGSGSFGTIYSAVDAESGERVAIKVESVDSNHHMLYTEYQLYSRFLQGVPGFTRVYRWAHTKRWNYMVMELLDQDLGTLFKRRDQRFSFDTVCLIAVQILSRLESLHDESGFLHRDLKPENILVGRSGLRDPETGTTLLYLVDLGLAKAFHRAGQHIELGWRKRRSLCGTARYASVNAHGGCTMSRRDDLENLAYVIIFLANRGDLPWMGIKAANKRQKYEKIYEKKVSVRPERLCRGLPDVFVRYLRYCKELEFAERPNYTRWKREFLDATGDWGVRRYFDWEEEESKRENPLFHVFASHRKI